MNDIAKTIGNRLAELRAERGLTLQDVADRTGLSKTHVWELEAGRTRNPSIDTAVRLARALGVSLDYLTGIDSAAPTLHPEAMRIACEVDALLRKETARTA
ncbi:hypothetical protein [EBPR siphovirus 5]|nr:hypothetical protein [EBPR siphovirus 5]